VKAQVQSGRPFSMAARENRLWRPREQLVERLLPRLSVPTLAEGLAAFEAAEVTAAPVYDIAQFIADPHVRAREIVTELPDDEMGSVPMHAVVPRLSGTPGEIRTAAPALGEHNASILGGLGLDAAALASLRERKVI